MKKIFKKVAMTICALALCVSFVGGPSNTIIADAATTKTRTIKISSPQTMGTYKAYLVDAKSGKSVYIGSSKLSFGNITLNSKVSMYVNKSGSFYVLLKYHGPGNVSKKSKTISITEQQLKTGFNSVKVNVNKAGVVSIGLSVL